MSKIVIDPDYYVDRWMTNYIVYHRGKLINRGEVFEAEALFGQKYETEVDRMKTAAMQQQLATIQAKSSSEGKKAKSSAQIARDLSQGDLLGLTLDQIANVINQVTDEAYSSTDFDNYQAKIADNAKQYSDLLVSSPDVQRVNNFFKLVIQGLKEAQAVDENVLEALTGLGTALIGSSFSIESSMKNSVIGVTNNDIRISNKVIEILNRAVDKFQASGTLSPRSFSQTIASIFKVTIGEKLQELMIAESLEDIEDSITQAFDNLILREKNNKLQWVDKKKKKAGKRSTIKIQIFNNEGLQLQVKKGKNAYNIEIGTGIAINKSKITNKKSNVQLIGKATLRNYFAEGEEKYLAYNMLAHQYSGGFTEAVNMIKGSVAASFFNNWLSEGGFTAQNGQKAQFLLINGKIYPVMRIISNICNEFAYRSNISLQTVIRMDKVKNTWIGSKPDIQLGVLRSQAVNNVMNKLYLSINLNSNILTKYAY